MKIVSKDGVAIEVLRSFHTPAVNVDVWDDKYDEKVLNLELTPEQALMLASALQAAVTIHIKL